MNEFAETITEGRIEATKRNNQGLGLAWKLSGNVGYGKLGESVKRYRKTRLGDDKRLKLDEKSPHFKDSNILTMENGEHEAIEINMQQETLRDDKPLVMAVAILQNSKLHFLRFIYDVLWKYLLPGSFVLGYCDTDSIVISKFFVEFSILTNYPLSRSKKFLFIYNIDFI